MCFCFCVAYNAAQCLHEIFGAVGEAAMEIWTLSKGRLEAGLRSSFAVDQLPSHLFANRVIAPS